MLKRKVRHIIDLDEMLEWIATGSNAYAQYAFCSEGPKKLEVRLAGGYRVTHGDDVVYEGTDGKSAVAAYNAI